MKLIFKERFLMLLLLTAITTTVFAQRPTDNLNRGLVAVVPRNGSGVFLSWRIQPYEYYDVKYNVYRNGTKIASNLDASNYMDASGSTSNTYTVRAVVSGTEQEDSPAAKFFASNPYTAKGYAGAPAYLSIPMKPVLNRIGTQVFPYATAGADSRAYVLNDVSLADLDGDGEMEVIVKRINQTEESTKYPNGTAKQLYLASNTTDYTIIEAYKLDGTRLWWIDCGPNMVSMNSVEINCVAYDWDEDGKAEIIMRGADNMIIHAGNEGDTSSDRTTTGKKINVGDMTVNTRDKLDSHTNAQYAWTRVGNEYLLYLKGKTAEPYKALTQNGSEYSYTPDEYPLKRYESDENAATITDDNATIKSKEQTVWTPGDSKGGYGHQQNKHFFGAPFLDGRNASIFLGRGIYTQIKMCALDVNKYTHELTQRWFWRDKTVGSPWYGQGNHNFSIADVDLDGCDEIIYGSMVIDNNGKGLSTTGLGHGDAIHVGDLDPYRKGLEVFACNEDSPANNYRDATTSEILFRTESVDDDGRALMGNFTDKIPGCVGRSNTLPVSSLVSATSCRINPEVGTIDSSGKGFLNGRIYWDGDLLEEYYTSTGTEKDIAIAKISDTRVMQTDGCKMNNDTKNNPCAQGDIIGDWREEVILRNSDNTELRIYSTDVPTEWRIPSLWYDHQYRQAMVWQVCGYNQPPHTSFFIGEMEKIERAPLPLTMRTGAGVYEENKRIEIQDNGIINKNEHEGKVVMLCNEQGKNLTVGIERPASAESNYNTYTVYPAMLIVNASSKVSGNNDNSNISTTYNRVQLGTSANSGKLGGSMRLVKQGDGLFLLNANRTHSYTGDTEIWEGSFSFRGTFDKSNIWMNRHTTFYCGATIKTTLTMEYGATLCPSKDVTTIPEASTNYYTANFSEGTINMHEGSRILFQYNNDTNCDIVNINTLNIRTRDWTYGPKYNAPVFEIVPANALTAGQRCKLGNIANVNGSFDSIIPECKDKTKLPANCTLTLERENNGDVYMVVNGGVGTVERVRKVVYLLDFEKSELKTDKNGNKYIYFTEVSDGVESEANASNSAALISQHEKSDGSHYYYAYSDGNQGGDRIADITFNNKYFYNSDDYELEFDWGFTPSGGNNSYTRIKTPTGMLCYIETTPGAYSTSKLYKADGTYLATLTNEGTNPRQAPTKLSHIKITSNINGTFITVTYNNNTNEYQLSNSVEHVSAIRNVLGRNQSHLAIDDIKLTIYEPNVLISETVPPTLSRGTYDKLNVTRSNFKSGYNTFCIPMYTTPAAVAGTNAKAYKFSRVQSNGNISSLIFEEVNEIEANKPYLIHVDNEVAIPTVFNNVTVSVAKSVEVEADGWKFVSNYTPAKPMTGNYMVYNDNDGGKLRHCGTNTFLNGLRAYFVGPSNASAKTLMLSFEDVNGIVDTIIPDDEINGVVGIYNVSGISQKSLVKGINIVKMNNGSVRKIYIK